MASRSTKRTSGPLFELQGGACYLCGEPIDHRDWALDDDKTTGEPRPRLPLLQPREGMFGDNTETLRRAASALENPPWRQIIEWESEERDVPAGS